MSSVSIRYLIYAMTRLGFVISGLLYSATPHLSALQLCTNERGVHILQADMNQTWSWPVAFGQPEHSLMPHPQQVQQYLKEENGSAQSGRSTEREHC